MPAELSLFLRELSEGIGAMAVERCDEMRADMALVFHRVCLDIAHEGLAAVVEVFADLLIVGVEGVDPVGDARPGLSEDLHGDLSISRFQRETRGICGDWDGWPVARRSC